jgi:hypothetical protein
MSVCAPCAFSSADLICSPSILLQDAGANLAELANPQRPVYRSIGQDIAFPWHARVQPAQFPRQIAASMYVGCMAAVMTSPIVAVTMTKERKP